jgi:YgiT-type zinc finger domain-containing protein
MSCPVGETGQTEPGTATMTRERGALVLVVGDVPAEVRAVCGEEYVDEATTGRRLWLAVEVAGDASSIGRSRR